MRCDLLRKRLAREYRGKHLLSVAHEVRTKFHILVMRHAVAVDGAFLRLRVHQHLRDPVPSLKEVHNCIGAQRSNTPKASRNRNRWMYDRTRLVLSLHVATLLPTVIRVNLREQLEDLAVEAVPTISTNGVLLLEILGHRVGRHLRVRRLGLLMRSRRLSTRVLLGHVVVVDSLLAQSARRGAFIPFDHEVVPAVFWCVVRWFFFERILWRNEVELRPLVSSRLELRIEALHELPELGGCGNVVEPHEASVPVETSIAHVRHDWPHPGLRGPHEFRVNQLPSSERVPCFGVSRADAQERARRQLN